MHRQILPPQEWALGMTPPLESVTIPEMVPVTAHQARESSNAEDDRQRTLIFH